MTNGNQKKEEEKPEEKKEPLTDVVKAAERIEKASAEAKETLRKMEELASRRLLGGQTDAGEQPPPVKEETPKEYKDRIMRGGK